MYAGFFGGGGSTNSSIIHISIPAVMVADSMFIITSSLEYTADNRIIRVSFVTFGAFSLKNGLCCRAKKGKLKILKI
jgi:hypothetical protein